MPLYDYDCPECGNHRASMRKVADRDLPLQCNAEVWDDGDQRLTSCDAAMVRNKVAAPAFALKGKGWARDGYKG